MRLLRLAAPLLTATLALALAACGDAAAEPAGSGVAAPGSTSQATGAASGAPSTDPSGSGSAGGPGSNPSPSLPQLPLADPAAVAVVRALIDGARLDDPTTVDALGAARFDDGAPEAAAAALADGAAGDARWAAVWTYASAGVDPEVLRPVLADEDPSLRALAAAALTAWGDPGGIPVLVSLVSLPDRLAGSYPPASVGDFAAGTLGRFVAGPAVSPDAGPAEQAAAWTSWLAEHGPATLRFDRESGTWSAS